MGAIIVFRTVGLHASDRVLALFMPWSDFVQCSTLKRPAPERQFGIVLEHCGNWFHAFRVGGLVSRKDLPSWSSTAVQVADYKQLIMCTIDVELSVTVKLWQPDCAICSRT